MFRSLREIFASAVKNKRARKLNRAKGEIKRLKDSLNFFAQQEFANVAARFLREGKRLTKHPDIDALVRDGLLQPHIFSQKSPKMIQFYRRLLLGFADEPKRIFEIGIKNGGSLMLWRTLFPQATIVGMDLGLSNATKHDSII